RTHTHHITAEPTIKAPTGKTNRIASHVLLTSLPIRPMHMRAIGRTIANVTTARKMFVIAADFRALAYSSNRLRRTVIPIRSVRSNSGVTTGDGGAAVGASGPSSPWAVRSHTWHRHRTMPTKATVSTRATVAPTMTPAIATWRVSWANWNGSNFSPRYDRYSGVLLGG